MDRRTGSTTLMTNDPYRRIAAVYDAAVEPFNSALDLG